MTVFTRTDPLGEFALRPVDPAGDGPLLHRWLTHPKSAFWLMSDASEEEVVRYFAEIGRDPGHAAYLGLYDGRPAFLAERYDPRTELGGVYPVEDGDVGMHFLVAPADRPLHGFTRAVITTVMEWLFADPATRRVGKADGTQQDRDPCDGCELAPEHVGRKDYQGPVP